MLPKTNKWPAHKVERRAVEKLKPYKNNARTHAPEQIEQIAASIREWGWTQPILIDPRGGVIAGHGRLAAAKALGIIEVPVIIAKGWTAAQRRAYVIADNQLPLNAGWDEELLRVEIGGLDEMGFDTELLGFGDAIGGLLGGDDEADDESAGYAAQSLQEKFGVVPFSVFRAAEGWWQDRKKSWLALGIESEIGRGENALGFSEAMIEASNGGDPYGKR